MLNSKLLLKVLPIAMLSFGLIAGIAGVARSQTPVPSITPPAPQAPVSPEDRKIVEAAKNSVPDLIKLLNHPKKNIQMLASSELARKGELAIPMIVPLLKHQDRATRSNAADVLGRMGEDRVFRGNTTAITESVKSMIPMLISLLKDQNADVRSNAIYALASMGEPATIAIPYLIPLLRDPDFWVSGRASYALGNMGEAAKAALISRLGDIDEMTRLDAAEVLREMGEQDTKTIPTLLLLLKSQRPEVRSQAIQSLGTILQFSDTSEATSSIIPNLISMLDDPNADVRSTTASTLGHIGEPAKSAVPKLMPLLKHPDRSIRLFAAYALGEMGESSQPAIAKLIPLLKDPDLDVRSSATDALIQLGYLKGKRNMPRLVRPAKPMRLELEVRPPAAVPPLLSPPDPAANVQSESVRQIFVQALKNIAKPDRAVEYRVMVASDGNITQVDPLTESAAQLLPRLEIAKRVQSANPVPTPIRIEGTTVVLRAFRVFVSSESIQVLAE